MESLDVTTLLAVNCPLAVVILFQMYYAHKRPDRTPDSLTRIHERIDLQAQQWSEESKTNAVEHAKIREALERLIEHLDRVELQVNENTANLVKVSNILDKVSERLDA